MKNSILIIDGDEVVRNAIAEILDLANYTVLTAADGKKGLELARTHLPDIILCAANAPVLDGYGVLLAMQNTPELQALPFILTAEKGNETGYRTAMDRGADDYLVKPFSGQAVLKVVNSHLRKVDILKKSLERRRGMAGDFDDEYREAKENHRAEKKLIRKFDIGDYLYHEGDRADHIYLIVSGKIKTSKINYWGKEFITDIFMEGDYFGYLALLDTNRYEESAVAIEPSQIEIIPRHEFFDLLHNNGSVTDSFIKLITHKLDISYEKLLSLAYDSARKKVAEALLYIHRKYRITGANEAAFPVKREIISSIAGLSPESVSRNLTEMSQEGLIKVSDRKIKIIDPKKLEEIRN